MPDPISAISGGSALLGAGSAKSGQKSMERSAQAQVDLTREVYNDTTARFEPYYQQGQDYSNALRFELLGGERPTFGGGATVNEVNTPATQGQFAGFSNPDRMAGEMYTGGTPASTSYNVGDQSFGTRDEADAFAATQGGTPYGGYEMSNGYKFQLDQGQKSIDNSAASQGGLFSGATLKAQQQFGQGIAAQGYDNYLNRLSGGAAAGQAAAGNQANAGINYASGAGQAYANMGNAGAAGAIGVGNALNTGIQNGIGLYNYMNQQTAQPGGAMTSSLRPQARPW